MVLQLQHFLVLVGSSQYLFITPYTGSPSSSAILRVKIKQNNTSNATSLLIMNKVSVIYEGIIMFS